MNLKLGDTQFLIEIAKNRGVLRNQLAYLLATTYHETAHTMKPVREYGGETYLRSKKYYPYVGMGYVQLTWDYNYIKAGKRLGVDFMADPKKLLKPEYAGPILVIGSMEGWFTGRKISDYITLKKSDYFNARVVINGDKNKKVVGKNLTIGEMIAGYARDYEADLKALGYGEKTVTPKPAPIDIKAPSSYTPSVWEKVTSWLRSLFS